MLPSVWGLRWLLSKKAEGVFGTLLSSTIWQRTSDVHGDADMHGDGCQRTDPVMSSWATAVRAIMTAVGFCICISRSSTFPSLVSLMSAGRTTVGCKPASSGPL